MKRNSLRLGTLYLFLGTAIHAASLWLTVIILSHWGGARAVGEYGFALAVFGPLFVFCHLGLRQILTTDIAQKRSFPAYLVSRNLCALAALCAALVGFAIFDPARLPLMSALGVWKMVEANIDIYHGLFQRERRFDRVALSRAASGIIGVALFAALFSQTQSVTLSVLGLAAGSLVVFWLFDLRFHLKYLQQGMNAVTSPALRQSAGMAAQASLIWLALPLGWAALLISLRTNIPRYLIEWKLGTAELGAFVALGYLITVFALVIGAMGRVVTPRLAEYAHERRWRSFRRLVLKALLMATVPGVTAVMIGYFFSYPIIRLIYGPEIAAYHPVFFHIMVLVWFTCYGTVLNHALEALHLFRQHLSISLAATVLCFVAVWLLLDTGAGLVGAAIGWTAAMAFQAAAGFFVVWRASAAQSS